MAPGIEWIDLVTERAKLAMGTPIVTIFGAGVAGLTAAHELVERGFLVQVVESTPDPDEEYTCLVGGLAANQVGRVPAELERLHAYLFPDTGEGEDSDDSEADRHIELWVDAAANETVEISVEDESLTVNTAPGTDEAVAKAIATWANGLAGVTAPVDPSKPSKVLLRANDPRAVLRVSASSVATGGKSDTVRVESIGALEELRDVEMEAVEGRHPLPERLQFERTPAATWSASNWLDFEDEHGIPNHDKVDRIWTRIREAYGEYTQRIQSELDKPENQASQLADRLSKRMRRREELLIELRGHTDCDGEPGADRALSEDWATLVKQELENRNTIDGNPIGDLDLRLVVIGMGAAEPIGAQRAESGRRRSNRVELRIVEHRIPGEHGYRFFPRFYRHLFDTMKRTPILDEAGQETDRTALDQLVSTDCIDVALGGHKKPIEVPVRRPRSIEELRKLLEIHLSKLSLTERDLLRFQARLLRFVTTCSKRRRKEYEDQSWWKFVNPPGRPYTDAMAKLLRETPQALVAMNGDETDARSQGVIFTQLLLDIAVDGAQTNRTLDGPTSDAWLAHWKRYLKRQGVRFFVGTLDHLLWAGSELLPVVVIPSASSSSSVTVTLVMAELAEYQIWVNSLSIGFIPVIGAGTTVADLVDQLAAAIVGVADLSVEVDKTLRAVGWLTVRPSFRFGSVVLRVRHGSDTATSHQIVINGKPITAAGNGDPSMLRDNLLLAFQGQLAAKLGVPSADALEVHVLGARSIALKPKPWVAIISIVSVAAGEYGVVIDGSRVTIDKDAADDSEQAIRNRLLNAINSRFSGTPVEAFGDTGIRIGLPGHPPIAVDTGAWEGRVLFGPDLRMDRRINWIFDLYRGDRVAVATRGKGVAVAGAVPEVSGQSLATQEIQQSTLPDGTVAVTTAPTSPGGGPDFYLLALPLEEASRVAWQAQLDPAAPPAALDGCLAQLLEFDKNTHRRDPTTGQEIPLSRDAAGRPTPPEYPLRDLSGIQYYFHKEVRVGQGHSYFRDAAWGLSSISQVAFWRERMSRKSAFLGQLSVDIGNWYAAAGPADQPRPTAWRSSRQAIAGEVWSQIKDGLEEPVASRIVTPAYYHLDDGIEFQGGRQCTFGRAAILSISGTYAPSAGDLVVGKTPILPTPGASPVQLAAAIETLTPHAAHEIDASRFAVAPVASRGGVIDLVVLETGASDYRVRVGSSNAVVSPDAPTTSLIRDQLVDAINLQLPGVLATTKGSNRVRLELASPAVGPSALAGVSALAIKVDSQGKPVDCLVTDPPGTLPLIAEGQFQIDNPDDETPVRNRTPFLINNPEVWEYRPGINAPPFVDQWGEPLTATPPSSYPREKREIYYHVSNRRWLMAGNHMASYTRLSTMESANESARHAVRSILHAVMWDDASATPPVYNGAGKLLGDVPEIWDPERYEFDDAEPLKRLDEALFAKVPQLPHFMEILRVDEWIAGLPDELVKPDLPAKLGELISGSIGQLESDWGFSDADKIIEAMRKTVKAIFEPGP